MVLYVSRKGSQPPRYVRNADKKGFSQARNRTTTPVYHPARWTDLAHF
jgi:hypothetical protein